MAAMAARKTAPDRRRPRAPGGLTNFDHRRDLELTSTSNAIEGNTLTAVETTLVIEHGITIGGKLRAGYPPVATGPEHRPAYMAALQADQAGLGPAAFGALLVQRLDETPDEALQAAAQTLTSDVAET